MLFKQNIGKILLGILCLMVFSLVTVSAQSNNTTYQIKENTLNESFIQGKYPEITTADSILTKVKINTEIEKVISHYAESIKALQRQGEEVNGYISYELKAPLSDMLAIDSRDGGYTTYKLQPNNDGIFSVLITCSTMYKNAAHPNSYVYGLTFDRQGNLISLKQILAQNKSLYTVDNLKTAVYAQAKDRLYTGDIVPVTIDKFPEQFYVDTDNNFHALFQQYEIAPYAAGIIDIVLK